MPGQPRDDTSHPACGSHVRSVSAVVVVILSLWTLARLVSKDQDLALWFTWWTVTGGVVGMILKGLRGLLPGALVGLGAGAVMMFYDVFLWLYFTLPPYPEHDL